MADGGSSDNECLPFIEDFGLEETEEEVTEVHAEGNVTIHNHHHYIHKNLYLGSHVYHGKGDIVQGSQTQVKDSQIEALIAPSGESDPPKQPQELSGDLTRAALEWIDGEKILPKGIENADDTSTGNQTHRKQILGTTDPGTSDTAQGARKKTKQIENNDDDESSSIRVISTRDNSDRDRVSDTSEARKTNKLFTCSSCTQAIQENILDIDFILLEEFKELALENANDKTALEMMNWYDNEDVEKDITDFLPLFSAIWRSIQREIVIKSLERHLASSCNLPPFVEGILTKLISKYKVGIDEEQSLHAFMPRINDLIKLGQQFRSNKNFIHAVVSFYAAGKLFKLRNDGNNSVLGITDCVGQILQVDSMKKQPVFKQIIIDHVIPLVHDMREMLRSIQGSTHNIRVEHETWCLNYIGCSYYECVEYKQSVDMLERAIDFMTSQFGDEVEKFKLYGICLGNAAHVYYCMGDHTKEIEKYKMTLEAARKANDWENDEEKYKFIARTKENVRLTETETSFEQ